MIITFLGTGTSQGVPFIGCDCEVCTSSDKRDNRLRSSVWIKTENSSIVIDSGPDFRYQMLRAKVRTLDAIIFTHGHKDHTAGMDDIRAYNYLSNKPVNIFATIDTQEVLKREYQYIFHNASYPGIPQINMNTITAEEPFYVNEIKITPIRVLHYFMEVLGFRIGDFIYITDANFIDNKEMEKIYGSKVLVLNALRHEKHISHYTLKEALEVGKSANSEKVYFTHISHQLGLHEKIESGLPANVRLAYDGLTLQF